MRVLGNGLVAVQRRYLIPGMCVYVVCADPTTILELFVCLSPTGILELREKVE